MTRDEAVDLIARRLRSALGREADIIAEMKAAQTDLEKALTLPRFLLSEVSSISTVSGEERVPVPADFLREYDQDALYYYNAAATNDADKWIPLWKDDMQVNRANLPGTGAPCAYSLTKDYFRIFPTPDDAYQLKMIYFKKALTFDSNIENEWLIHAPELIIGIAGKNVAAGSRDTFALERFAMLEKEQRRQLHFANVAAEQENMVAIMGGVD